MVLFSSYDSIDCQAAETTCATCDCDSDHDFTSCIDIGIDIGVSVRNNEHPASRSACGRASRAIGDDAKEVQSQQTSGSTLNRGV